MELFSFLNEILYSVVFYWLTHCTNIVKRTNLTSAYQLKATSIVTDSLHEFDCAFYKSAFHMHSFIFWFLLIRGWNSPCIDCDHQQIWAESVDLAPADIYQHQSPRSSLKHLIWPHRLSAPGSSTLTNPYSSHLCNHSQSALNDEGAFVFLSCPW